MGDAITLQKLAYRAISKQSRRIFKYETGVLLDKDSEDLHQMRVGMRRLRSAIACFAIAIDVPSRLTDKSIAKIARSLGKLRDLDVLLDVLTHNYRPQLPTLEQKTLDRVIQSLHKQRRREFKQVRKTLNSKSYANLRQALDNWLERPQYLSLGGVAIDYALPDLLLPQVSQFLLHPGWLVGVNLKHGKIKFPKILNTEAIEQLLARGDVFLHNLRKSAKKTRYTLEFFAPFYGNTYHKYLQQIEEIQEILGQTQDIHVMRKAIEQNMRSPIAQEMPQFASLLLQIRYQKWLEWQKVQQQFLKNRTRQEFRQAILAVQK